MGEFFRRKFRKPLSEEVLATYAQRGAATPLEERILAGGGLEDTPHNRVLVASAYVNAATNAENINPLNPVMQRECLMVKINASWKAVEIIFNPYQKSLSEQIADFADGQP